MTPINGVLSLVDKSFSVNWDQSTRPFKSNRQMSQLTLSPISGDNCIFIKLILSIYLFCTLVISVDRIFSTVLLKCIFLSLISLSISCSSWIRCCRFSASAPLDIALQRSINRFSANTILGSC